MTKSARINNKTTKICIVSPEDNIVYRKELETLITERFNMAVSPTVTDADIVLIGEKYGISEIMSELIAVADYLEKAIIRYDIKGGE